MIVYEEDVEEFLEHFGVPGMKWGVRRERRAQRMKTRFGVKGTGVAGKLRGVAGSSPLGPIDLVKGRGITGGLQRKGTRQVARNARVKAGESSIRDKIAYYGGSRVSDLVPVRTKNVGKQRTIMDRDKLVVAAAGALFVAQQINKRAQRA